jgi:hypothetical protein
MVFFSLFKFLFLFKMTKLKEASKTTLLRNSSTTTTTKNNHNKLLFVSPEPSEKTSNFSRTFSSKSTSLNASTASSSISLPRVTSTPMQPLVHDVKCCIFDEVNSNLQHIEYVMNREVDQIQFNRVSSLVFSKFNVSTNQMESTPLTNEVNMHQQTRSAPPSMLRVRYKKNTFGKQTRLHRKTSISFKPSFRHSKASLSSRKYRYSIKRHHEQMTFNLRQRIIAENNQLVIQQLKKKVDWIYIYIYI